MKLYMDNKGNTGMIMEQGDATIPNSFAIILIALILVGAIILFGALSMPSEGIVQCPYCNSKDTRGMSTFWYNDGGLCNGSHEYNLDHADFTFFSCNYCGKDWKVYRQEWEALGY